MLSMLLVAVLCTSVVVFLAPVGQLPHTPTSSGELQSLSELALCVLSVVTCLTVKVECAQTECAERPSRCTSVIVFLAPVGHLPHTPTSSGELQSLPQLALCVLSVVTCLTVKVECAQTECARRPSRCRSDVVFLASVVTSHTLRAVQVSFIHCQSLNCVC
jgi:hypothetical protein